MGRPKKNAEPTPENPAEVQTEMFAEVCPPATNKPPKIISRNEYGLVNGVDYVFNEDGLVDWRAMIPKKFIVINSQYEDAIQKRLGKPLSEVDVSELEDREILILLGGFRYLAELRGFKKIEYSQPSYGPNGEVCVSCTITAIPNYESEGREIVFTGVGEATRNNTTPIGKNQVGDWTYYLAAIAENRAFVRGWRNLMRISSLGKDELQSVNTTSVKSNDDDSALGAKPIDSLLTKCKQKGVTWLKLTEIAAASQDSLSSDYTEWKSYKDIPAKDIYILLGKIANVR